MARKAAPATAETKVPCKFKNINFGDKIVSIGFSVSRGNLTVGQADKLLTCKRLTVKLFASTVGSAEGQSTMFKDGDLDIEGVADCGGFTAGGKAISGSLAFLINSIDGPMLSKFAKRDGQIIVTKVEDTDGEESEETET